MAEFKDANGEAWLVRIDVNALRRVRDQAGLDLMRILEPEFLAELGGDAIALVGAVWAIIEPQAIARQVTPEQFAERLVGDALANAADALIEGMADFFPKSRGQILRKMKAKADALDETATAEILATIEKMDLAPQADGGQ